ncbi:MAG: type II toxin-antitoxin system RelE family toxin [Thermodesulfobacteriota bacterium]
MSPEAIQDLKRLWAHIRAEARDALEIHLRNEPTKVSRSQIKRLKALDQPQYRLRVDKIQVFYDVNQDKVEILAIVTKDHTDSWLTKEGKKK